MEEGDKGRRGRRCGMKKMEKGRSNSRLWRGEALGRRCKCAVEERKLLNGVGSCGIPSPAPVEGPWPGSGRWWI